MADDRKALTTADAANLLAELAEKPTTLAVRRAHSEIDAIAAALSTTPLRIGVLSSFTWESMVPCLQLQGLRSGIRLDPYIAPFGQFEQSLIDPNSEFYGHNPDVCLVAIRLQDQCPRIYNAYNSLDESGVAELIDTWFARLVQALRLFRSRSNAPILVQNYDLASFDPAGVARLPAGRSQSDVIRAANERLLTIADEIGKMYVMDYERLVSRHGRMSWSDARTSLLARIPVAAANFWSYAGFVIRYLRPLFGKSKKVLVLDADNTLWGGISGDVGFDNIVLGQDFPGSAFVLFQRRILDLHHRGVVLCIASKNESKTVTDILENHPGMILRPEHFSAMQINWDPKPGNLRLIADRLNLGIDSFVFVDDSPVECELMRQSLPEVLTLQLPPDPAAYSQLIEGLDVFDQLSISAEDKKRGRLYKEEADRRELQTQVVDLDSFYRQLQTTMSIHVDATAHKSRASQMCNRTNQFNMNTIRYTDDDIARLIGDPDHDVVSLQVSDRFGDNGVVGLAIVRYAVNVANIHVFLMSCRVLGRQVEQAFLKWIARRAVSRGCDVLNAEYVETPKNKPFGQFYGSLGMVVSPDQRDDGVILWTCRLSSFDKTIPEYITIVECDGSKGSV